MEGVSVEEEGGQDGLVEGEAGGEKPGGGAAAQPRHRPLAVRQSQSDEDHHRARHVVDVQHHADTVQYAIQVQHRRPPTPQIFLRGFYYIFNHPKVIIKPQNWEQIEFF